MDKRLESVFERWMGVEYGEELKVDLDEGYWAIIKKDHIIITNGKTDLHYGWDPNEFEVNIKNFKWVYEGANPIITKADGGTTGPARDLWDYIGKLLEE